MKKVETVKDWLLKHYECEKHRYILHGNSSTNDAKLTIINIKCVNSNCPIRYELINLDHVVEY